MAQTHPGFEDQVTVDRVSLALRNLQIKLWTKSRLAERIVTQAGRAESEQRHKDYHLVADIVFALEEGRLEIHEPTEDTMAQRMATEVDLTFGTTDDGAPHE